MNGTSTLPSWVACRRQSNTTRGESDCADLNTYKEKGPVTIRHHRAHSPSILFYSSFSFLEHPPSSYLSPHSVLRDRNSSYTVAKPNYLGWCCLLSKRNQQMLRDLTVVFLLAMIPTTSPAKKNSRISEFLFKPSFVPGKFAMCSFSFTRPSC